MTATTTATTTAAPAPIRREDRIIYLDILRGWAVLGILAVNAATFAWPSALEFDPTLARPWAGSPADLTGQWVVDVFFGDKFRSLFSMLFGVSIFLIGGERHDEARSPVLLRRLMWLGLFGLIHGAAIWMGDILLHYAYCGLIAMLARSWSGRRLVLVGGGLSLLFAVLSAAALWAQGAFAGQADTTGGNPFAMTPEDIQAVIASYQSGWPAAQIENFRSWLLLTAFSIFLAPVTVALMWLGLGLFKTGFFTGRAPVWVYLLLAALAAGNLAFYAPNAWMDAQAAGAYPSAGMAGIGSSFAWVITLGYASVLILMTRFGLGVITRRLAPVGQMAFTNYLTQSLIMASLFYMPWAPLTFGDLAWGPAGLWLLVGGVWVTQLIWSPLWLSRFEMGPLEWLWRGLTYGRLPPLVRRA